MTAVLHSHLHSSPTTSSSTTSSSPSSSPLSRAPPSSLSCAPPLSTPGHISQNGSQELDQESDLLAKKQLSLLALLLTLLRKSFLACKSDRRELCAMEIGWPTNVRHVAHVTFDRFNGFLGLPVELEPEVPRRPPSASATVFGVSTESMQLSYDSRGNCVPTILLLMQRCLYDQGGLQAEGIFRINAGNSQEESVRDQLNSGVVPEGIDVHCLAGLIKAWFRELPMGILDPLSPEQVTQCESEEDCAELVRYLPPTEAALLDWAINLMADVVQHEHLNKMNARNIAMVFAPNMTQMADPLTALMYAVQVMNFLKALILRTLREREDSILEPKPASRLEPFDENDHESPFQYCAEDNSEDKEKTERHFVVEEPFVENSCNASQSDAFSCGDHCSTTSIGNLVIDEDKSRGLASHIDIVTNEISTGKVSSLEAGLQAGNGKDKFGQSSNPSCRKASCRMNRQQSVLSTAMPVEKTRGICNLRQLDSRIERIEAWR